MGILDRLRKPGKFVLMVKSGRGFQAVAEYLADEWGGKAPSQSAVMDEMEEGVYYQMRGLFKGGGARLEWERAGVSKKRERAEKEVTGEDFKKWADKSVKPLQDIGEVVKTLSSAFREIAEGFNPRGESNPDDVRGIISQEIAQQFKQSGMTGWQMPQPGGWIWAFHPWVRASMKETIEDVKELVEGVTEKAVKTAMGEAEAVAPVAKVPSPFALLDKELKAQPPVAPPSVPTEPPVHEGEGLPPIPPESIQPSEESKTPFVDSVRKKMKEEKKGERGTETDTRDSDEPTS